MNGNHKRVWQIDGYPRCKKCHVLLDTICNDCGKIHFRGIEGYCKECYDKQNNKKRRGKMSKVQENGEMGKTN